MSLFFDKTNKEKLTVYLIVTSVVLAVQLKHSSGYWKNTNMGMIIEKLNN